MAKGVCTESLDLCSPCKFEDDLRPTPDRDRFPIVATGLREKERSTLLPQSALMLEIPEKQFTAGSGIWNHALPASLSALRANPECAAWRVDVIAAETAQLLTAQPCIVCKRQHDAVADRLLPSRNKNAVLVILVRNPGQLVVPGDHRSAGKPQCRRVVGPHSFFHQIGMEQTNHRR